MSQPSSSAGIAGGIIVAGLLIAAAIVFGPRLAGLLPPAGSQPTAAVAEPLSPVTPPAAPPSPPERKSPDLELVSNPYLLLDRSRASRGWFFIDGECRKRLVLGARMEFAETESFAVSPGRHELVWVLYPEERIVCLSTALDIRPDQPTFEYQLPAGVYRSVYSPPSDSSPAGFACETQSEKTVDGVRIRHRQLYPRILPVTDSHDVWFARGERGLKDFIGYDLWKVFGGETFPSRDTRTQFPDNLGGLREVDADEMKLLRTYLLKAHDCSMGFSTTSGFMGWVIKADDYLSDLEADARKNRKAIEYHLDLAVKALAPDR